MSPAPDSSSSTSAVGPFAAVVMDIDGTMVGDSRRVSPRLREAIRAAQHAGATVTLATGRMKRSTLAYAQEAGVEGPLICYQGAMTLGPCGDGTLRHVRLDAPTAGRAVRFFKSRDAHVNVYVDDEVYVERLTPWCEGYEARMGIKLRVVPSLAEVVEQGPTLVLGVGEPDATETNTHLLTADLGTLAVVTRSLPHFCEVGSPHAGKEAALDHLSVHLGLPPERFVTFGDGLGDAGMLRWAGLGVAMEDGHPAAITAADRVAPGPASDGVAMVLEELLEQGKLGSA